MTSDDNIVSKINRCSLIILSLITITGIFVRSPHFGLSILIGGIIAIGNNFWLRSIVKRVLTLQAPNAKLYLIIRYILRLFIIAVVLVILMKFGMNIIGLLIGLSVVPISIMIFSILRLRYIKGE
jgi:hypothetical protein